MDRRVGRRYPGGPQSAPHPLSAGKLADHPCGSVDGQDAIDSHCGLTNRIKCILSTESFSRCADAAHIYRYRAQAGFEPALLAKIFGLTPAEAKVASVIAEGASPEQAAEKLRNRKGNGAKPTQDPLCKNRHPPAKRAGRPAFPCLGPTIVSTRPRRADGPSPLERSYCRCSIAYTIWKSLAVRFPRMTFLSVMLSSASTVMTTSAPTWWLAANTAFVSAKMV